MDPWGGTDPSIDVAADLRFGGLRVWKGAYASSTVQTSHVRAQIRDKQNAGLEY